MNAPRQTKGPLSDINIIPLVDVMLVLLIIFMIAAPMMQQGLPVDLPKTTARPLPSDNDVQIVTINRNREILLNSKKLEAKDLRQAIEFLFANKSNKELFLRADSAVPYGFVVRCMGIIKEAGIEKVNVVTRPLDER